MANVLVTIPNLHWMHTSVSSFITKLALHSGHQVMIRYPSLKPYENYASHTMVDFLEGNCEFWLSVDDDNPPGQDKNPLDLCNENLDIVGFPTPVYHFTDGKVGERPIYYNAYKWHPDADEGAGGYKEFPVKSGLQEVDAVGFGMFLMHRRVFENPEMQKQPFERRKDSYGRVILGADLAFCQRAKAQGFKIYCAYSYPCDQFSEISLAEMARATQELIEAERAEAKEEGIQEERALWSPSNNSQKKKRKTTPAPPSSGSELSPLSEPSSSSKEKPVPAS